jgi:hypothetical protein
MCVRVLAAHCARGLRLTSAPKSEGAGKTGCALHPRSRVQFAHRNAHTSIQVQREHPGLPCAVALRLLRALPSERLFCHCRRVDTSTQLDASTATSGPHDFAVRSCHTRQSWHPRPPRPVPTFVTMADALLSGQDGGNHNSDLPDRLSGKFLREGLDHPNHFDPFDEIGVFAQRPLTGFGSCSFPCVA